MKIHFPKIVKILIFLMCYVPLAYATDMKGVILEKATKKPMHGVTIMNIYSNRGNMSDSSGAFNLKVNAGELVEISKFGYQTIRIRIPKGQMPKFYNLEMDVDYFDLEGVDIFGSLPNHVKDSLKKTEVYRNQINLYKLDGFDMVQHPFDALSKRNRQIWAFQKHYAQWEQDKFVDYVFNDNIILQLTGIDEKDLQEYKRLYRPNYNYLQQFDTDYEYYEYLKYSGKEFLYNKYNRR